MSTDSDTTELNCHYVSKFLVKPWAITQARWPSVSYIDINSKTIEQKRIEKLFARKGMNSERVEKLLRDHIETPIGAEFQRSGINSKGSITDWKRWCAFRLLSVVQSLRFGKFAGREFIPGMRLDEFLEKIDAEPDFKNGLVMEFDKHSDLLFVTLQPGDYLFYPETGYFLIPLESSVPVRYEANFKFAVCIPLTPSLLLIDVPKDRDRIPLGKAFLCQWSTVPVEESNRYIVAPELLQIASPEVIISEFFRFRQQVSDTIHGMQAQKAMTGIIKLQNEGHDTSKLIAEFNSIFQPRLNESYGRQQEFLNSEFGQKVIASLAKDDPELLKQLKIPTP